MSLPQFQVPYKKTQIIEKYFTKLLNSINLWNAPAYKKTWWFPDVTIYIPTAWISNTKKVDIYLLD